MKPPNSSIELSHFNSAIQELLVEVGLPTSDLEAGEPVEFLSISKIT